MTFPAVSKNRSRIRAFVTSEHTKEQLDKGAEVILTVDCGISSFEPLKAMSSISLDLIVIDHHNPDTK